MIRRHDPLKDLRISRPAVAKILWHAIEAGADTATLRAICGYISDPADVTTEGIDNDIYEQAASETDSAARRSAAARAAAMNRRAKRSCLSHHTPAGHSPQPTHGTPVADTTGDGDDDPHGIRAYVREVCRPSDIYAYRRRLGYI